MSELTPEQHGQTGGPDAEAQARTRFTDAWRASWPALLLVVGSLLLIGGASYAVLTKPKRPYMSYLDRVEKLITQESYSEALSELNRLVFAYSNDPAQLPTMTGRARQLAARAIYLGQRELGLDLADNHSNVVNEYLAAEELGISLTADDLYYIADTYVRLERPDRAVRRAEELPADRRESRAAVYRSLVEWTLGQSRPDYEAALEWTTAVANDSGLSVSYQIWVVATRTRIRMAQGYTEEAVERLVQSLVRLQGTAATRAELAELYVLLGKGYAELGQREQAVVQLERAAEVLGVGEALRGHAELELARLEQDSDRRLARFRDLVEHYPTSEWMLPGLLGLAETLASQNELEGAQEVYDRLIAQLLERGPQGGVDRGVITESLLTQHRRQMDSGDVALALQFGRRIEPLYEFFELPDRVLTELARANRLLAGEMLPNAGETGLSWADLERIDPATRTEVQSRLLAAARYFAEYARRVVLTSNTEFANALWQAAHAYDLGGDLQRAIAAYQEYASGFPDDSRRYEAMFRLAQAFQVTGQHDRAAALYERLISGRTDEDGTRSALLFGEASFVPLAQTLLADSDPQNDGRAQQLLEQVVSGSLVGPSASAFREALFELTRLHFTQGQHARAIERLAETIERFPQDARVAVARFRLAEAHRHLAGDMRDAIAQGGRPDSELQELEQRWDQTLRSALLLFDDAIEALDAVDPRRRDDLHTVSLRNAFFYRGDCAFDLGEFEAAIRYYDEARDRYSGDPAALVAMVQIVNAHVAMGDLERARTANERARRFFASLPEEVWQDPYLPMSRQEWERWLDSTDVLYRRAEVDR